MTDSWEKKTSCHTFAHYRIYCKVGKKKKVEEEKVSKKETNRIRDKTRIYIGDVYGSWRGIRDSKGLKTDAEVAVLLLDR